MTAKLRLGLWKLRSRVPGTVEHRAYRDTVAWVDAAEEALRVVWGDDFPAYPRTGMRHPAALKLAIEVLLAHMRTAEAFAAGRGEAYVLAVLDEHLPAGV